ncbi:MAG TPA: prephenate dehydratase [Planctomycetota bacterium]|nr:prephenate dehydratase [Planctomycetota bacterium]
MTDTKIDVNEVRKKVDLIDFRIVKLLNERMEYVMRIKRLKEGITDQKREQIVMGNVQKHSQGLVKPGFAEKLFNEIISESKRIQQEGLKSIGFQGEHGAYGEVAALSFDNVLAPLPCREFVDVFDEVSSGQIDLGIVPVENSLEGAVTEVNDLLAGTDLKITGEVKLPIHHSLLALPETDYREIKAVYSHPQALAQCRGFLSRNNLEPTPFYDTAGAAKMIANARPKAAAAIASRHCAELYDLEIIKEEIEDDKSNFTRFLILAKESNKEPGNKCSIVFSTRHEAGTLFAVLKIFSDAGINLTRIESRPIRTDPGKYAFFLDFQGSEHDDKVTKALESVKQKTVMFKFLGCYKEAKL